MAFKMKYEIKKQYLTPGTKRRSGTKLDKVGFITAHDTGNPNSTAEGNVGYYQNSLNDDYAAAHLFVDDNSIVECIPLLTGTPEKACHVIYNVTTDNKLFGDDANDIAGGVELCWGPKIDGEEAYKRYLWTIAYICYKFKLNPAKDVVGHQVLDPKRKIDPGNGLKHMGKTYEQLLKDIVTEYNDCTRAAIKAPAAITGGTYKVKEGDSFWKIANQSHGKFTVDDLIAWNPKVNPAKLKIGQVLQLKKPTK